eukprot:1956461-Prymnesium_polylepis.1
MPHECRPRLPQRTRTSHRVTPPRHSPDARCTPPPARRPRPRPPRSPRSPCVLSPDPAMTPGCPVPGAGAACGGAPGRTAPPCRGMRGPRASSQRTAATACTSTHRASPS